MVSKIIRFHPYAQVREHISIGTAIGNLIGSAKSHFKARATIRELSKLSDRQLQDIGIERHAIPATVFGLQDSERAKSRVSSEPRTVIVRTYDKEYSHLAV